MKRVVYCRCDHRADRIGAAFAAPFKPKALSGLGASSATRIEISGTSRGGREVICKSDRQWLAIFVVTELLKQCSADTLRQAAGDLAFD